MKRLFVSFPITSVQETKARLLHWADGFGTCCVLDNHQYDLPHHVTECLVGAGVVRFVSASAGNAFTALRDFSEEEPDWLFGHFAYDLKNEIEGLTSCHPDRIGFPDLHFFVPVYVLELRGTSLSIGSLRDDHGEIFRSIMRVPLQAISGIRKKYSLQQRFSREEYRQAVGAIRRHQARGDCYELNFCQESFAEGDFENPTLIYGRLSALSPAPFAAYYRLDDKYLLCASPERYLQKKGEHLLTQPIKGTIARAPADPVLDEKNRLALLSSPKERSENIMVVDLVRNDLAKVCEEGSVEVEDLCRVYGFPQVFQMISSVRGISRAGTWWAEPVRATFPMGSMTGAPKKKVLQLIESYEKSRRGLYSGAVGYVTPERDFDFNVVIRSMLLDRRTGQLSYSAGSAITIYSDADLEYQECLLKVRAIEKVLTD